MPQTRKTAGRPRLQLAPDYLNDLRRAGLSFREIARRTGLGYGSVRRACAQAVRTNSIQHAAPDTPAASAGQISRTG